MVNCGIQDNFILYAIGIVLCLVIEHVANYILVAVNCCDKIKVKNDGIT